MHDNTLRLAPRTPRVPIDDVLIELTHEDFADRFEADGVNVGVGGLSMRAAILPDVGSKLRCSFQSPADGEPVEAGCEVVWAADSGRYMGEFGLRFTEVDTRSALALRRLVEDWAEHAEDADEGADARAAGDDAADARDAYGEEADAYGEEADAYGDARDAGEDEPPTVALKLDGVASPLVAELVDGAADAMVVEQELPFLRLGTGVSDDEGRRGRLHAVDLRLEGELPRLVLTVRYEDEARADAYSHLEADAGSDADAEADTDSDADTDSEAEFQAARAVGVVASDESLDTIPDEAPASPKEAELGLAASAAEQAAEPAHYGDSAAFSEAYDSSPDLALPYDDEADGAMRRRDLVGDVRARIVPAIAALRAWVLALWARLVPAAREGVARMKRAGGAARAQGRPMVERGIARMLSQGRRFVAIFRERAAAQAGTRRRTQQVRRVQAPRGPARAVREEETSEPQRLPNRRKAVLGAVTLGVVGLGGYGMLSPGSTDEVAAASVVPVPAPGTSEAASAAPAASAYGSPAPSAYGSPAPSAYGSPAPSAYGSPAPSAYGSPAPSTYAPQATGYASAAPAAAPAQAIAAPMPAAAAPEVPRALPEPDYEAGPMPAPTYPALGDARSSSSAPPAMTGGQSFGAASVADGTPFTLNMSTPIGALYGEATDWGFIVRIPGSLSLSRASPIAQNHPAVERAAIRNLGDSAELTIRFVEGRAPAYRVEARGTRLVVILGR